MKSINILKARKFPDPIGFPGQNARGIQKNMAPINCDPKTGRSSITQEILCINIS